MIRCRNFKAQTFLVTAKITKSTDIRKPADGNELYTLLGCVFHFLIPNPLKNV